MKNLIILPLLLGGLNTQPNNANITNFNINPTITNLEFNVEDIDEDYYVESTFKSLSYTNTIFNITGNICIQSLYSYSNDYIAIKTNKGSGNYTSMLYYFEINTTKYIENAELDMDMYMSMQQSNSTPYNLALNYTLFYSTSAILNDYTSGWQNAFQYPGKNYNLINQLVNGNITSSYTTETDTTNGIQEHTTANINPTLTLLSGITNYVFVYVEPYIRVSANFPITEIYYQNDTGQQWVNVQNVNNMISLSGQYDSTVINQEVIDIPGMMFEILTMPFTFISMAFNLTLFPGTPYIVHVSSLFLTIIGILIFVWILKKLVFK